MGTKGPKGKGKKSAPETPPGLSRLPPGRHGLPREFVIQNQRDRLAAGIISTVAEHGYHDATISQIVAAAGLSRRTFYKYYSSKEECFFDTYDMIVGHLTAASREAAMEQPEWPEKVRARLSTLLGAFATNPDLARYLLIAPARAGDEVVKRYADALQKALDELLEGIPKDAEQPSKAMQAALMGGAAALVVRMVEAGEGEKLPELLPDLTGLILGPFLGREEAVRQAQAAS